jgi:uncharacterized repeat protein (TIGR03809 family)
MTHRTDVARGRGIVLRWRALAEQRLEHLTELFETGRWRRYHSEVAFLENIQEAKAAVKIWDDLLTREVSRDNRAVDFSWLDHTRTALALRDQSCYRLQALPLELARSPTEQVPLDASIPVATGSIVSDAAPSGPAMDEALGPMPNIGAVMERYPLLRNPL